MTDHPRPPGDDDLPDRDPEQPGPLDPFLAGMPPELRGMFEQLGAAAGGDQPPDLGAALSGLQAQLGALMGAMSGPAPTGPVDWRLAEQVAAQVAAEGDRVPDEQERVRARDAASLAEHWLDASPLPAPPDAGRLVVASRRQWAEVALVALRPLVEPVARAATDGLIALADEQLGELTDGGAADLGSVPGLEGLPPGFESLLSMLSGQDLSAMLRPASAALAGLQAGQVVGQLSRQLLGQYDLGIPTAPRSDAYCLAVNVAETFEGYGLDPTEVAIVLAVSEGAYRRLYHAVPWLEAQVQSLVGRFAAGTEVDADRLRELSEELLLGVDPSDPEALEEAMRRAATFRLEPTPDQQRVLQRLQGIVSLVGAWARHEVARAVRDRLPSLGRIEEVLRRRRATRGDGEQLLANLLGLDLKPADETVAERFVAVVEAALGPEGLHRALAHPENLPDAEELADPTRWLARTGEDLDVPDDASALFAELGDAPVEASADERSRGSDDPGSDDPAAG